MKLNLVLNKDEISEQIPYPLICTIRYSSMWNTKTRKSIWKDIFGSEEIEKTEGLFRTAYNWYIKGLPESTSMDLATFTLWTKLAAFCELLIKELK